MPEVVKGVPLGRLVLGASAVLFGVIALMWHDADTWQSLHRILRLPLGQAAGSALMSAQIAGGIALFFPQTVRPGARILIGVFALTSFTCIFGIAAAPNVYAGYGSFFEQFSMLCGAVAVYGAFAGFARTGLGVCAVSFTLSQVVYLQLTAGLVPRWIPPNQMFWAVLTTAAFALAALALLANVRARLASRLMGLMVALFGLLVWVPLLAAHPEAHGNWSEFALTMLIAGASLAVAETLP